MLGLKKVKKYAKKDAVLAGRASYPRSAKPGNFSTMASVPIIPASSMNSCLVLFVIRLRLAYREDRVIGEYYPKRTKKSCDLFEVRNTRQQALPLKIDCHLSNRPNNSKIFAQNVPDILEQCSLIINSWDPLIVFAAIFLSRFESPQAFIRAQC